MSRFAFLDAQAPLGVFDSGLGGLTVVHTLRQQLPHERLLYVADQAHVPYGGRELGQVCGFACGISEALIQAGCKAIVMACNISSATALPVVQSEYPDRPVLGVIAPGARAAAAQSRSKRIGVLATAGTVQTQAYTRALHTLDNALEVREVACPRFVPLVEAGEHDSAEALAAAREYLFPLQAARVDTVILGCTHYPFLLPVLRAVAPELTFVNPAEETARELALRLQQQNLLASPASSADGPQSVLATTGDAACFAAQTRVFLPDDVEIFRIAPARWEQNALRFDLAETSPAMLR